MTWQRMLVIGALTAVACADAATSDDADTASGSSHSERASSSRAGRASDAGPAVIDAGADRARTLRDAGRHSSTAAPPIETVDAEPDAEMDSDVDAGFPELVAPVLRDCTETLRCDTEPPTSLEECIALSTTALARATPEARRRFIALVMRCEAERGCDYVSCTRQP